jgi:hypothetical protein
MENTQPEIKTIPLSTNDIIGFFQNPDHFFFINYNNSSLKKESFLTYLANMKMKCDLIDYQSIALEDRVEMLSCFLNHSYVIEVPVLKNALISLLLYTRTGEMVFDYLSKEEAEIFIKNNKEMIDHACCFFDSMILVLPSMSHEFKEKVFDKMIEENQIEIIENANSIGINTFALIACPDFLDMFIGLGQKDFQIRYYKYAIDKFSYKNKKLFQLIVELESPSVLMSLFNALSSEEEEETKYFEILKEGA